MKTVDFCEKSAEEELLRIIRAYARIEKGQCGTRTRTYKVTQKGLWATSVIEEIYQVFVRLKLSNYEHFVDLGSGDGRVVAVASLFTKATGIEIDRELHEIACEIGRDLGLRRAEFILGDFTRIPMFLYDFTYIYPDNPNILKTISPGKDQKGRILVGGPHFVPEHWKRIFEMHLEIHDFYLYEYGKS